MCENGDYWDALAAFLPRFVGCHSLRCADLVAIIDPLKFDVTQLSQSF